MIVDIDAVAAKIVALINEKPRSPTYDEVRDLLAVECGLLAPASGMSSVEVRNRYVEAMTGPITATEILRLREEADKRWRAAEAKMFEPLVNRVYAIVTEAQRKSMNPAALPAMEMAKRKLGPQHN